MSEVRITKSGLKIEKPKQTKEVRTTKSGLKIEKPKQTVEQSLQEAPVSRQQQFQSPTSKVQQDALRQREEAKAKVEGFNKIVMNPKDLWSKSPDEVEAILGEGWTRGDYSSGWKFTNGDKMVFHHPGGGVHKGSYFGFSSGKTGKVKVVGPDYKAIDGDKATIINK